MAYQDPEQQTSTIKPPARNPAASVPGVLPIPALTVPSEGNGVNPITRIVANLAPARDKYGNDMTATNKMKAQLGEAPVGQAPAVTPAPAAPPPVVRDQYGNDMTFTNQMKAQLGESAVGTTTNPLAGVTPQPVASAQPVMRDQYGNDMTRTNQMKAAMGEAPVGTTAAPAAPAVTSPAPVVRDQYGNDMTATNAMKKQLGEAPITSPAASVPGLPAREAVQTRGYVATQSGQMNPSMERVINAQPNPILASVLNGKQTTVPQITGALPVQNVGPATPGQSAGPQANPIALAAQATAPALLAAKVANPPAGPQSLPSTTPIADQAATATAAAPDQGPAANPLTSINMQANNDSLARANTIRQQMIDGDGEGPKVTMLENSGLKETQALMDKWGRQDMQREMLQEISRNPRAANAIAGLAASANNTEAEMRRQDVTSLVNQRNAETTQRGQDVLAETERRGQDLRATSEGNRLAGNPLENQLKSVQIQAGQSALDRAAEQDKALAAIRAEQDPVKRQAMIEAHLAGQGKNPLTDRYITLRGGEETRIDGTRVKDPDRLIDVATRQALQFDAQPQNAQAAATAPPPDKRVVGQKYQTPKGPMIWRGTGWEAA